MSYENIAAVDLFVQDAFARFSNPNGPQINSIVNRAYNAAEISFFQSDLLKNQDFSHFNDLCFIMLDDVARKNDTLKGIIDNAIDTSIDGYNQISSGKPPIGPVTLIGIAILLLLTVKDATIEINNFKFHIDNHPVIGETMEQIVHSLMRDRDIKKISSDLAAIQSDHDVH